MSLFLRRRLQKFINELQGKIRSDAVTKLVKSLNGGGAQPLATEWEVVLLWGFTRLFDVENEPGGANAAKVDLVVFPQAANTPLFAADIRVVSDVNYHKANPVDRFSDLLGQLKSEVGLSGNVEWRVEGDTEGEYHRAKMKLNLPDREEVWEGVAQRVRAFYVGCKRSRNRASILLDDLASGLTVGYDPIGRGLSGGFPSYVSTYNIRRNPVANSLGTKRQQLIDSGASGLRGTILCDGGCNLMHTRSVGGGALSLQDVVLNFLQHETDVDFVVTVGVESSYPSPLLGKPSHKIKPRFFSLRTRDEVGHVYDAVTKVFPLLPAAEISPENARNWYSRGVGQTGHKMQPMTQRTNEIVVSARWLMDLLSGRVTAQEAFRQYGIESGSVTGMKENPFRIMLEQGKLPAELSIVVDPDTDDDAVVFKFSKADPAIAPFVDPQS